MSGASSGPSRSRRSRWCWWRSTCRSPPVSVKSATACIPSSPPPGSKCCTTIVTPGLESSSPTPSCWASRTAWWSRSAGSKPIVWNTATAATVKAATFRWIKRLPRCASGWRREWHWPRAALHAALTSVCALAALTPAAADQQRDPELKGVVAKAIAEAQCFSDQYDSAVWYTLMEPRLRPLVKDRDERLDILKQVYCETHRTGDARLPPGLVMAVIAV